MLPPYFIFLIIPLKIVALIVCVDGMFLGKLKPDRISLALWSLPPMIGFATAISSGSGLAAIPVLLAAVAPLGLLVLSLFSKNGAWKIRRIDYICAVFAMMAITVWIFSQSLFWATFFAVLADVWASIPTIAKAWTNPETDSLWIYVFSGLGNMLGLGILTVWNFASAGFSVYLVLLSIIMITVLLRKKIWKPQLRHV